MRTRGELPAVQAATAIEQRIFTLRGERVILDEDLAVLYGVTTGALNQAVNRNAARFPDDFMFRLTAAEAAPLKSQSVISSAGHGGRRRSTPRAFTEQGVAMLSSMLRSPRAVAVNILIMRTFVQLRRAQGHYAELRGLIKDLAQQVAGHDDILSKILEALAALERTHRGPPVRSASDQSRGPQPSAHAALASASPPTRTPAPFALDSAIRGDRCALR